MCLYVTILAAALLGVDPADEALPAAKPIPALRIVPQPGQQFAFRHADREIVRYHCGPALRRPFLYPLIGPAGEGLTRIGHPHDANGHSHHNSVWCGHANVGGVDFWSDRGGQIVHRRFDGDGLMDGADAAQLRVVLSWVAPDGRTILEEKRQMTAIPRPRGEWLLVVALELIAPREAVELGKTPFGPMAVRMAKSIGVHDGGGLIRNSAGGRNEAGCFWKPAKWVDYSGPISATAAEGITLMDHPDNPRHPPPFHVRDDGWMGVAPTQAEPLTILPGQPLRLRYGLWVHGGVPAVSRIDGVFNDFSRLATPGVK